MKRLLITLSDSAENQNGKRNGLSKSQFLFALENYKVRK